MEWAVDLSDGRLAVAVPGELVPHVVEMLSPLGLVLDPYRDRELSEKVLPAVVESLQAFAEERQQAIKKDTLARLGISEMTAWAKPASDVASARDDLLGLTLKLLELCDRAVKAQRRVLVLGP